MISSRQLDTLKEFINIGMGRGASALNKMLKSHIRLYVPSLKIISAVDLKNEIKVLGADQLMAVNMGFDGDFSGGAQLIFSTDSAKQLVEKLLADMQADEDIEALKTEMLCEVGNIVLNAVVGAISNILGLNLDYTIPTYQEGDIDTLPGKDITLPDPVIILARMDFNIEELNIDGDVALLFGEGSFSRLLAVIEKYAADLDKNRVHGGARDAGRAPERRNCIWAGKGMSINDDDKNRVKLEDEK